MRRAFLREFGVTPGRYRDHFRQKRRAKRSSPARFRARAIPPLGRPVRSQPVRSQPVRSQPVRSQP
jgi:AraC-like DNA-binding protein